MATNIEQIKDDFEFLDDWEDRYRYVIELGKGLEALPDADKNEANKVSGCVSQVWVRSDADEKPDPIMSFIGDSDALIVKGLVAIMIAAANGRTASEIENLDMVALMEKLGLDEHLSPQRANGLRSLITKMKQDAKLVAAAS
ncbi:MAG: SufE family protein [Pseudomonadota bacterium]